MATADDQGSDREHEALPGPRYTEYRGRGFWCRDGLLEVWLAAVVDELDRRRRARPLPPWLDRLRDDWCAQATIVFDGIVSCRLDDHVIDEPSRAELSEICRHVQQLIGSTDFEGAGSLARRVGGARLERAGTAPQLERVAGAFLWVLDPPSEVQA